MNALTSSARISLIVMVLATVVACQVPVFIESLVIVQGASRSVFITRCSMDDEFACSENSGPVVDYDLRGLPADTTVAIDYGLQSDNTPGIARLTFTAGATTPPGRYDILVDAEILGRRVGQGILRLRVLSAGPPSAFGPADSIAAGRAHSTAIINAGTLTAWGGNSEGQLGLGDVFFHITPETVNTSVDVVSAALGTNHSLAALGGGAGSGWGSNSRGQLGSGLTRRTPALVSGASQVTAVAAGHEFSLFLDANRVVWSSGRNQYGQLGQPMFNEGGFLQIRQLTLISGLAGVQAIAAGDAHSLALLTTGNVWAWGRNISNQLGVVGLMPRSSPAPVPGLINVVAIAAGEDHSLALRNDGTVWAWGENRSGQLGLGDSENVGHTEPEQVPGLLGVQSISAAGEFSLALDSSGSVWAWGSNSVRQLGDPSVNDRNTPARVLNLDPAVAVAAGGANRTGHSLALLECGAVWSWGGNAHGQLGDGTTRQRSRPVPVQGIGRTSPCNRVALRISILGSGSGTVTSDSGNLDYDDDSFGFEIVDRGTMVALSAQPSPGSSFDRWTGDCSGVDPLIDVQMDTPKNCAAVFSSPSMGPYLLTVDAGSGSVVSGGGGLLNGPDRIDCGSTCNAVFGDGAQVELTAAPSDQFSQWSGDCSGTSPMTLVTMDGHKMCRAEFSAASFTLTVTRSGPGAANGLITVVDPGGSSLNCGTVCSDSFPAGTPVVLSVAEGSVEFWDGCVDESPTQCFVVMDDDLFVEAIFSP